MDNNRPSWTFFSNHGHIYFLLAANEDITAREIAMRVGITERAVLGIIQDLNEAGYIIKKKVGRANRYSIISDKTLRHPLESNVLLKDLVDLISKGKEN
ncbi:winged helix-turn-helix domain-containing protein [Bacteriovorax sp. DB6_IX]|uniref:winged helix-turn-helix domain-containing protein n=1 Tax=Bacteriovorax sp. DB6_IX TaxID=1353530 RepID=UPI000389DB71|nr:winged helix-turn-helix domain-containing protein [Bacteriovorax sp. DB6_IX]EQC46954.1 sugar-specific transcriptional regulator, TrmB family [Bacteriovorax sp. DB6_IX]